MQNTILALATCSTLLVCGCHQGLMQKRQSEMNCPTDIRKTIPWCAGEDSVFRCPCGPSANFYGHKPTCWGNWPASGAQWRDSHCGCPIEYPTEEILSEPVPASEPLPEAVTPQSNDGNPLPAIPQPAEQQAEPLFVPPQPAATQQQSRKQNVRFWDNRMSSKSPKAQAKHKLRGETRIHSGGVQQTCHIEEVLLEPHAWTGIKFVR